MQRRRCVFFCVCIVLLAVIVVLQESVAFVGGAPVQQQRTIGGKNPLKQPNLRKGNPQTRVYHNRSCPYFKSKSSTIYFKSADEAKLSGFRPCPRCGG
ncbi:MAG: hypothetical protein K6G15_00480 [Desulfovibrio sp.]|nr:hypothetical protein [Desulfovibrio sp.]